MLYKITWTETAINDYLLIVDYLIKNWGEKSAYKFRTTVNKQLNLISKMPSLYQKTEMRENLRRCIVVKQISMYYCKTEHKQEITIVRFLDNRQSPVKIKDALNDNNK